MTDVVGFAKRVASTALSVLITGETGTGKEVVARFVHDESGRQGCFVPVDCAALAAELADSELFGHVRGAFTGALADRKGLLESANGGTVFFDEIGELPPHLQTKLLRVLDRREIRPVGASRYTKLDLRVVAATNRDLKTEVAKGTFREDLYYRLAGARIHLPPLRERLEDIPLLVESFTGSALPRRMLDGLEKYNWPGNVRQLLNCTKCFAELKSCPLGGQTGLGPTCEIVQSVRGNIHAGGRQQTASQRESLLNLADRDRSAVMEALALTQGSRREAAALLGIGRTTLYRRLRQYGTGEAHLFNAGSGQCAPRLRIGPHRAIRNNEGSGSSKSILYNGAN